MFIIRGVIYLLALAAVAYGIGLEAIEFGPNAEYNEQSLTERLQDLFTFSSAMLFYFCAYHSKPLRQACVLLGSLMLMMWIRESDSFLDQNVFDGAWQVLVSIVLVCTLFMLRKHVKESYFSLRRFSQTSSFGFVTSGLVIILAFSRMMGRGEIWESLLGETYIRAVKNIVEEGVELLGYSIVMIAAVELCAFVLANRKQENASAAEKLS